jgi:hypothetical protein
MAFSADTRSLTKRNPGQAEGSALETWPFGTKSRTIRLQKQRLIDIPGAKVLAHGPSLNQSRWV